MNSEATKTDEGSRLQRAVGRSFDLVDNVLDNVDQLVTTARKDGLSVAREFVSMQISAGERLVDAADTALRRYRDGEADEPESAEPAQLASS